MGKGNGGEERRNPMAVSQASTWPIPLLDINISAVDFLVSDARIWTTESDCFSSYPKCSDNLTSDQAVSKWT